VEDLCQNGEKGQNAAPYRTRYLYGGVTDVVKTGWRERQWRDPRHRILRSL